MLFLLHVGDLIKECFSVGMLDDIVRFRFLFYDRLISEWARQLG